MSVKEKSRLVYQQPILNCFLVTQEVNKSLTLKYARSFLLNKTVQKQQQITYYKICITYDF
jgi:hypothetical protein